MESNAKEADLPQEKPTSAPTHARQGIIWLVVGHAALGLVGVWVAYLAGSEPTLRGAAFVGLVFGQTSLLGIWGGLGTCSWLKRLIGVVTGVICLVVLLGIGVHEVNFWTFTIVVVATSCVLMPLLIVRCCRVVIHLDSSSVPAAGRIQFSIRHLMILTFVVACLVSLAKMVQPHVSRGYPTIEILLLAVLFGVVGVLPVWFTLATKRPTLYGLGLVAVGAGAGYCYGWKVFGERENLGDRHGHRSSGRRCFAACRAVLWISAGAVTVTTRSEQACRGCSRPSGLCSDPSEANPCAILCVGYRLHDIRYVHGSNSTTVTSHMSNRGLMLEDIADLWFFEGPPDRRPTIAAHFQRCAAPTDVRWALSQLDAGHASLASSEWKGECPVTLERGRYFVVVGALLGRSLRHFRHRHVRVGAAEDTVTCCLTDQPPVPLTHSGEYSGWSSGILSWD